MKLRYGHVTNSSSSSYIIAFDQPTSKTVSTIEQLLENLQKDCGWDEDEAKETSDYIEGKELIEAGKHIIIVSVDCSDPDIVQLFEDIGLDAEIRMLPL